MAAGVEGVTLTEVVNLGAAGAVILVVALFLRYMQSRDAAVQHTLEHLNATVSDLHGFLKSNGVRRCPVALREMEESESDPKGR